LAITVSLLLISASKIIEQIFNSEVVAKGVILIAPGLILFSINKVLSAILNGMLYMKEFAVAQALRPLTIILCIAFCIYAKFPEYWLSVSLSFGELTTFLWLSIILFKILPIRFYIFKSQQFKNWMYQHFLFGIKGFVSGFLAEINTRVDVIMLGIFVSDEMVGVYSFASMFAEGFYMLTTVIRNNINPILSKMVIAKDFDGITKFIDKIRRWFCPTISLIILIFISLYPLFLKMVFRTEKYDLYIQSWLVIIILLLGILVASGYIPFENILIQGGNPTYQSLLTVINVTSNIIFNAIFIPLIGISGAAIGTTCAYLISTVYLCQMVQHCFGFSLFRLNFSSK
jgi:O-antigen/teichoic acid export membrane protein